MTPTISGPEPLREDTRQRVRVPAERREALVDEFEKSGLSGARFARMVGVKYPTFANWVARRRRERLAAQTGVVEEARDRTKPIQLWEAVVEEGHQRMTEGPEEDGLSIELPGGSRVAVHSPVQLKMVVELVVSVAQRMNERC